MDTCNSKFVRLVLLATVLAGCSGGGGGSNAAENPNTQTPPTTGDQRPNIPNPADIYTGSRSPANINIADVGSYLESFESSQSSTELATSKTTAQVGQGSNSQPAKLQAQVDVEETEVCTDGGTLQISGNLSDTTGLGTLNLLFNECRLGDDVLNGEALLELHSVNRQQGLILDATQIYNGTSLNRSGDSFRIYGSERIEQGALSGRDPVTTTLNYLLENQNTGEEIWYQNFVSETVYEYTDSPPTWNRISTVSGRLYVSDLGYVELTTASPQIESRPSSSGRPYEANSYPVYLLRGEQDQAARLSFYEASIAVEVDNDGNGTFERSAYVPIAELGSINSATNENNREAPVAAIGGSTAEAQPLLLGQSLPLNSRESRDADLNALSHQWQIVEMPIASELDQSQAAATDFSFTPDVVGVYIVSITVDDGQRSSSAEQTLVVYEQLASNELQTSDFATDQMAVRAYAPTLDEFLVKVPFEGVSESDYRLLGQYGMFNPNTGQLRLLDPALNPLVYPVTSNNSSIAVFIDSFPGSFNDSEFMTVVNLETGEIQRRIELNTEEDNSFGCCISIELRGNRAHLLMETEFTQRAVGIVNLNTGAIAVNSSAPYGDVDLVTSQSSDFFITLREQNNYPLRTADDLGPQLLITLRRYVWNSNAISLEAELQYGFESEECSTFNDSLFLINRDALLTDECGRVFDANFQSGMFSPNYFYNRLKTSFNNVGAVFDSERYNAILFTGNRGIIYAYSREEDLLKFQVQFDGGGNIDSQLYESAFGDSTYFVGGRMTIASIIRF